MEYIFTLTVIGIAALGMAWMPSITKRFYISYSIIYVIGGVLLYSLVDLLPSPKPVYDAGITIRLTELVVIVSLMGSGLKIDQPFSLKTWAVPFRLVTITMVLCIAAVACISYYLLGFDWATSVLIGAVLAPTDPVLASDVQVGPPLEKTTNKVRFSLTAEAGMNDGMAFPFTWLAIILATVGFSWPSIGEWVARDVIYKIVAGIVCGYMLGRFLAFLVFYLPEKRNAVLVRDGFVAIAATLMVYGVTEMVKGYGFMAVFVTAITLRNYELNHKYHRKLHDFTDQIERMLVAIMLLLFGGSLVHGILKSLDWYMVGFGLLFVLIVRPVLGLLSLIGSRLHFKEKFAISFFGIRGMGSFYYLAFALQQAQFAHSDQLWSIISFIVLLSIIIHGFTATSVMENIEGRFSKVRKEEVKG